MKLHWNNKVIGNFEPSIGVFTKNILEDRHLLYWDSTHRIKTGGVPSFDADAWDSIADKVKEIKIATDKGRIWSVVGAQFNTKKVEHTWGNFGRQYYLPIYLWNIFDPNAPKPEEPPKTLFDI